MWKVKEILNLIFAKRFFLFTHNGTGHEVIMNKFRVRDGEYATGFILDRIADTLACEDAVLKAKEIINK